MFKGVDDVESHEYQCGFCRDHHRPGRALVFQALVPVTLNSYF